MTLGREPDGALYRRLWAGVAAAVVVGMVVGCAGPVGAPATSGAAGAPQAVAPPPRESRTLNVAIRVEPSTIATRPLQQAGVGLYMPERMFNAQIAYLDGKGATQPFLVEAIPVLGSDSWRVNSDGRMETTYRLRPNVTWHDGTSLTAEDFVFSWRAYSTPALGHATLPPFKFMDTVVALDARTFVVNWRQVYPDTAFVAGVNTEFPPVPRHILEPLLQADAIEAFVNHPRWTREFVGLGAYRLDRWEAGAFLEGAAFDGHVLGRPKIDRIKLNFMSDARAVLASILAGEIHLTDGTSAGLPEVAVLKRQWIAAGKGEVHLHPNQWRGAFFQFRPEYLTPRTLLNPVVRKALAHAVDRQPLNDALYDGDGIISDSMFPPQSIWGPAVQRGAVQYPYDLQRAEQLMRDAGFTKGADGAYTSPTEGRFSFEVKTNQASDNESEVSILASTWRQAGFDAHEAVLPAALAQNPEARSTYTGMYTNSQNCCESAVLGLVSTSISRAENRWSGGNRSGWSHAEFDRLADTFTRTLDRAERDQQISQLLRIITDDVQSITLFIRAQAWTPVTELRGLAVAPPEGNMAWDIRNWEFR